MKNTTVQRERHAVEHVFLNISKISNPLFRTSCSFGNKIDIKANILISIMDNFTLIQELKVA